jgi:hypothetical protein
VEYYRASAATSSSPFPADVLLPDSITWVEIPFEATGTGDAPSARIGHTMTAIGSHYFVLYGGRNFLGGTMAHGMTLIFSLLLTFPPPSSSSFPSGVFLYHLPSNQWSDITPGDYHREIADRTGHCCLPTSHGLIYFGGLTGTHSVTSDVIFLDLFSRFDLQHNSHKDQYEYVDPASSPSPASSPAQQQSHGHVYQQITRSLSQYFHFEGHLSGSQRQTYCPIRLVNNL